MGMGKAGWRCVAGPWAMASSLQMRHLSSHRLFIDLHAIQQKKFQVGTRQFGDTPVEQGRSHNYTLACLPLAGCCLLYKHFSSRPASIAGGVLTIITARRLKVTWGVMRIVLTSLDAENWETNRTVESCAVRSSNAMKNAVSGAVLSVGSPPPSPPSAKQRDRPFFWESVLIRASSRIMLRTASRGPVTTFELMVDPFDDFVRDFC